ncbi:TPA: hypothetical protein ACXEM2_004915 [Enterobacter hormaechei]
MNANGFKKFEHDRPYGRFGFRQNLPVCIQHHGSGVPGGCLSQPETTRHKQVSLIITKSHQGSGRKPNMAYLLLTATQKKFLQDSGQE